jgi:hypothetical protein
MTSSSDIDAALAALTESGLAFVLMIEETPGALSYYSNNKGDRLYLVNKEE